MILIFQQLNYLCFASKMQLLTRNIDTSIAMSLCQQTDGLHFIILGSPSLNEFLGYVFHCDIGTSVKLYHTLKQLGKIY